MKIDIYLLSHRILC